MTDPLARLTALLSRLPGVGEKSAMRLALALVRSDFAMDLADAIRDASTALRRCSVCRDLASADVCPICSDPKRDGSVLCIVAHTQDRIAMERASIFRGRYHVLHGVLDPLAGVGPAQLEVPVLLERLRDESIREVIVATSPTQEGDVTAIYLADVLRGSGIVVSRIAAGVAVGSDLEYADPATLGRALGERRTLT